VVTLRRWPYYPNKNVLKKLEEKNPALFHIDRIWNDGPLGFFWKTDAPNNKKNKNKSSNNKISSDMRSVPDQKRMLYCAQQVVTSLVYVVVGCWRHGSQFIRTDSTWPCRQGQSKVKLSRAWSQTPATRYADDLVYTWRYCVYFDKIVSYLRQCYNWQLCGIFWFRKGKRVKILYSR